MNTNLKRIGGFVIALFVLTNLFLLFQLRQNRLKLDRLERESIELLRSNAQSEESNNYADEIMQKNIAGSYQPIVHSQRVDSLLEALPNDSYLLVRYSGSNGPNCLKRLFTWLDDVKQTIGDDKLILLQIGKKDSSYTDPAILQNCTLWQIEADELYVKEHYGVGVPYLFIYKKGEHYPFLFSLFPENLMGLELLYANNIELYFKEQTEAERKLRSEQALMASVEQCDTALYIRHACEAWDDFKLDKTLQVGDVLLLPTGRRQIVSDVIVAGSTIRYPYAKNSTGNCCAKSHLERMYQVLSVPKR